jgi:hypothetical protein
MEVAMTYEHPSNDLQNLWQSQPATAFQMSLDDIHNKAVKMQKCIYWRNCREYISAAIVILSFAYCIWTIDAWLPRLGAALNIAGALYIVYRLNRSGSARPVPADMGMRPCLDFHLRELERQRGLIRSVWSWYLRPMLPGMVLFMVGVAIEAPLPLSPSQRMLFGLSLLSLATLFVAPVFYWVYKLNQRGADNIQQQIDEITALAFYFPLPGQTDLRPNPQSTAAADQSSSERSQ